MDAGKAVELGFADSIIKRTGGVENLEMPQVSMLYSKTAVTNSLMDKVAEKCRIQQDGVTGVSGRQKDANGDGTAGASKGANGERNNDTNKVKADSLMSRLNLLKNWR